MSICGHNVYYCVTSVPSKRQAEPEQSDGKDFDYTELDVGMSMLLDAV